MVVTTIRLPEKYPKFQFHPPRSIRTSFKFGFIHVVVLLLLVTLTLKFLAEIKLHELLHVQSHKNFIISKHDIPPEPHQASIESNNVPHHKFDRDSFKKKEIDFEIADFPSKTSLLNITNFKWIRNNISLCQNADPSLKVLPVLVHTSRNHFMERQVIRNTWGSSHNYRSWSVRPVFLMGEANPKELDKNKILIEDQKLDEESHLHGDIVTGSFIDSYRNLSYKHLMGYKWALDHCSNEPFVMKVDDDMFVDITYFIDMRMADLVENSPDKQKDLYCGEFIGAKPLRGHNSKWYVSLEEWPEETYPRYCSGWAYGIMMDWINKIYLMSLKTKYFWVDDVFIGILLSMAQNFFRAEPNVARLNGVYTYDNRVHVDSCNGTEFNKNSNRTFGAVVYLARSEQFSNQMECLWKKVLADKANNAKYH